MDHGKERVGTIWMECLTSEQLSQFFVSQRWANFDPNWITNSAEVFNVCAIQLSRTVANPQKVCRGIIIGTFLRPARYRPTKWELAGERLFIVKHKTLVTCVINVKVRMI